VGGFPMDLYPIAHLGKAVDKVFLIAHDRFER
jgi:hypothetical protein